jgi:hypothetical protein
MISKNQTIEAAVGRNVGGTMEWQDRSSYTITHGDG